MRYGCQHCGEAIGDVSENADGLAGALTVRCVELRDGAVHAKCRRCSKFSALPLRMEVAPKLPRVRVKFRRPAAPAPA